MQRYNVIAVFSPEGERWLLCRRVKPPYRGLFNLVGGKIEPREWSEEAAYRELREETGIGREAITLTLAFVFEYNLSGCSVEFWVGQLDCAVSLREEKNPLCWMALTENYFDVSRFAGRGNLGHILLELSSLGIPAKRGGNDADHPAGS